MVSRADTQQDLPRGAFSHGIHKPGPAGQGPGFVQALVSLLRHLGGSLVIRIGLGTTMASMLSLTLLSTVLVLQITHTLESRAERMLEEHHTAAANLFASRGISGFDEVGDFYARMPEPEGLTVERFGPDGVRVSGSAFGLGCDAGFRDVTMEVTTGGGDNKMVAVDASALADSDALLERFRVLSRHYGDQCLTFGSSLYELDAFVDGMLRLDRWSIPICLLPAILVGLFASHRVHRRLGEIDRTLERVADGELSCRIQVTGINEIDRLAHGANRSFDRLQNSVETLQQLSSTIAHDLRSPLARLSVPLEQAIDAGDQGRVDKVALERIAAGVTEMREIFDALLRVSQIESGRRREGFREIDVAALVIELGEIYEPVVEDAGMHLRMPDQRLTPASLIHGDRELLQQALSNLLENAIRYCPDGATIGLSVHRDVDQVLCVTVVDDGPGIPVMERERVFERLYRIAGSAHKKSGTGLGLTLVRAVAELHRGTVSLEDAEPGLRVQLRFPRSRALSPPAGGVVAL